MLKSNTSKLAGHVFVHNSIQDEHIHTYIHLVSEQLHWSLEVGAPISGIN